MTFSHPLRSTTLPSLSPGARDGQTRAAIGRALAGQGGRLRRGLLMTGPAVVASIAYMDPGNFATNIQAGARFGYSLLWVVLAANLVAMLFQALSAKLGIVTGRNLAEMCRDTYSRPVRIAMWALAELAAMATDLAEFLGGAIGLSLLFGLPLVAGMAATAAVTLAILTLERSGFRTMEILIGALVGTIGLCYLAQLFIAPVEWGAAARGTFVPHIAGVEALTIAVGIVGATVMPHAVFLHSGLTQGRAGARSGRDTRTLLTYSNREVVVALAVAGMVNMAMVMVAAAAFHAGHSDVAEIETAYKTLTPLLGGAAAGLFLLSLIASGISSSVVGTMAGQMIMQGFVGMRIPVWLRRLVTMLPAFAVVLAGVDTTRALVLSQVVLSFALPLPMITLLIFTSRREVMGEFVNGALLRSVAWAAAAAILALNVVLLAGAFGMPIPGLG